MNDKDEFWGRRSAGIETVKTLVTLKTISLVIASLQATLTKTSTTINFSTRTTVMVNV